jgi:TRAP-type C4-dicarboxylate transport system permease large subunit
VKDIVRELAPFMAVLVAVLALLILVPSLVLALPHFAGYR